MIGPDAKDIARVLRGFRFRYSDEDTLQASIGEALSSEGFGVDREYRLSGRDRVDLLVAKRIGIEVKIAGSTPDVARQLARYAKHDEIKGLVLVSDRPRHSKACAPYSGKPVVFHSLAEVNL